MKKLLFTALGAASMVAVSQAQDVTLWDVASPTGGSMNLTAGAFDSATASTNTAVTNFTSFATSASDWSAYGGQPWTFEFDIYMTAAQLANTNVNDDTISYEILDGTNVLSSGGWLSPANASWWKADAWNHVIWQGTFPSDFSGVQGSDSLTNVVFALVNNDKATHDVIGNYTLANLILNCNVPNYEVLQWEDTAPEAQNMALVATTETIVTGGDTGHGDIGAFNSTLNGGQWANYGIGGQDWSQYAGGSWRLSVDLYITSAQLADPNINDDLLYYSVAGGGGGYAVISEMGLVADAWNTITYIGVFTENAALLGSTDARVLINDQVSHPAAGDNLYLDNFKFETTFAPAASMDVLWSDPNPSGGMFTLVTNAYGDGIGEFNSSINAGQWENYGTYNNDWSAYAGQGWSMTFDLYVEVAQAGDTNVTDDSIFYSVAGVNSGYTTVSNEMIAGEWSTITWTGTFDSDPSVLTNVFARLQNNDFLTHPVSGVNYYVRNFQLQSATPPVSDDTDKLWTDEAPSGGILAGIADPFATGQGTIGMYKSAEATGTAYGVSNQYWAAYAGQDWTLTFDVYIQDEQASDGSVTDDTISFSVAGVTGGAKDISTLAAGTWNTITWTGTFNSDPDLMAISEALLVIDDNGTQPVSGPDYFFDNFSLRALKGITEVPPEYARTSATINFVTGEGYADGSINGQDGWASAGDWTVDVAGAGTATSMTAQNNMTLGTGLAANVGETIKMVTTFMIHGEHDSSLGGWTPQIRLGLSRTSGGNNRGYDNSGLSEDQAHTMVQSSNNTDDGYRVYGNGWGGNGAKNSAVIDGMPSNTWEVTYILTVGDSPATTTYTAAITNLTLNLGASYNGDRGPVGEEFYDAVLDGQVYPYIETANLALGVTGVQVQSIELEYSEIVVSGYGAWVSLVGLVGDHGDEDADLDGDGMINLGEYAFGGDPMPGTGSDDIGVVPTYDGTDYTFSVIGDDGLTVNVMSTDNIVHGPWVLHENIAVPASGTLDEYTSTIGTGEDREFIRLEVTK